MAGSTEQARLRECSQHGFYNGDGCPKCMAMYKGQTDEELRIEELEADLRELQEALHKERALSTSWRMVARLAQRRADEISKAVLAASSEEPG